MCLVSVGHIQKEGVEGTHTVDWNALYIHADRDEHGRMQASNSPSGAPVVRIPDGDRAPYGPHGRFGLRPGVDVLSEPGAGLAVDVGGGG